MKVERGGAGGRRGGRKSVAAEDGIGRERGEEETRAYGGIRGEELSLVAYDLSLQTNSKEGRVGLYSEPNVGCKLVFNREQNHGPCASAACQSAVFLFSKQIADTLAIMPHPKHPQQDVEPMLEKGEKMVPAGTPFN
ncbi:hypothetical protein Tco_1474997 [Tanacetum coccineum]